MRDRWESSTLGELCQIDLGKKPCLTNDSLWDKGRSTTNVWLSIGDLLHAQDTMVSDSKKYMSGKGASISKVVKAGTLLLSIKLTLGRLAFAGRDLFTSESIAALTVRNEKQLSKKFLYYFLSFFDWNAVAGECMLGKLLNKPKLKAIVVRFPKSLAEQEGIVILLDKVGAITAKLKENTEKNLKNICEVFQSYLQNVFVRPSGDCCTKKIGELASKICRGETPKGGNKAYKSEGIPLIRSLNVHDKVFKHKNLALINEAQAEKLSRAIVEDGDILLNRTGSVARCCLAPTTILPARTNEHVLIIRVDRKVITPAFLNYLLISKPYKDELLRISNENCWTRKIITKRDVAEFDISFPDTQKQQIIVEKLDRLSLVTQKLMSVYQQALSGLEKLKNQYSMKLLADKEVDKANMKIS